MVVADLHVHTTNSDGSIALADVPAAADRTGVRAVCITDHDRLHPDLRTPVAHLDGVTVVHGIELRVDAGSFRIDLLGYGARRTDALAAEVERLQANRIERGRAVVDRVEDRLGVDLDIDLAAGVGRPHVAHAIERSDAPYDYDDAFAELIGDDGPCYVARDVPSLEDGLDLLAEACGNVGLAHPFRYPDPAAALELCSDPRVGAVERWYPYDREVDARPVERAAERYDLVPTGGSDAHDDVLGRAGLDRAAYRRFRSELTL
ncbi:MAG: PHP domain-containing protein [Haloarculaceae archaeon]